MEHKLAEFQIRGMNQDLSPIKFKPEFAFENRNIRIISEGANSLLSLTNEKGTKKLTIKNKNNQELTLSITGIIIGQAVINNVLILFSTKNNIEGIIRGNSDYIYKIVSEGDTLIGEILYNGNLNFNAKYPLETLVSYESDKIQKIYWVDGLNQPRFININDENKDNWNDDSFNFVGKIGTKTALGDYSFSDIEITKNTKSNGLFAPGTIQYAFTYYNKFGKETNIFWVSNLYYISHDNRGASPEDKVNNVFDIILNHLSSSYDYVRIYSIHKTSINAVPEVKRVIDIEIPSTYNIEFHDTGLIGDIIDPTKMLYIGGEKLIAGTITQKDNTLFLGNIKLSKYTFSNEEINTIRDASNVEFYLSEIDKIDTKGLYIYHNQLEYNASIKGFKGGETYKLAIQFRDPIGKYSEPVYLGEFTNTSCYPNIDSSGSIKVPKVRVNINLESIRDIISDYTSIRVLIDDNYLDRKVICQGVLNPTLYNLSDRESNLPHNVASWFFRPFSTSNYNLEWKHNFPLPNSYHRNGEIQSVADAVKPYVKVTDNNITSYKVLLKFKYETIDDNTHKFICTISGEDIPTKDIIETCYGQDNLQISYDAICSRIRGFLNSNVSLISFEEWTSITGNLHVSKEVYISRIKDSVLSKFILDNSNNYYIDQSTLTFNSPDLEANQNLIEDSNIKMRIVGIVEPSAVTSDYSLTTKKERKDLDCDGLIKYNFDKENISDNAKGIINAPLWNDSIITKKGEDEHLFKCLYALYPWQRENSIINDAKDDKHTELYANLKRKVISNLRYCYHTKYFKNSWMPANGITKVSVFNSNEPINTILESPSASYHNHNLNYYGNVDKIVYNKSNDGYPLIAIGDFPEDNNYLPYVETGEYKSLGDLVPEGYSVENNQVKDPIHIKYKSTPHAVFSFNYTNKNEQVILPSIAGFDKFKTYDTESTSIEPLNTVDSYNDLLPFSNRPVPRLLGNIVANDSFLPSGSNVKEDSIFFVGNLLSPGLWKGKFKAANDVSNPQQIQWVDTTSDVGEYWLVHSSSNLRGFARVESIDNGFYTLRANISPVHQDIIENENTNHPYLYLAELYRDNITREADIEDPIKNIKWIPASDNIHIIATLNNLTIEDTQGDTYFQRWDCLKTYPYTQEDGNSIVEILSFMCETRTNIDGRYDKNRGQKNNLAITPNNFNLYNPVYNQPNNTFNYRILDERFRETNFPNTITWTLPKQNVALTDSWTNITMASTLNLDGNKGKLNALRRFNNDILAFQDKGISQILYNENVQLTSTKGVPIEIANSGKVQGKRYLSENIGCINKWSISNSPSALYFVDNINKSIYRTSSQGIENISDKYGFHSWSYNNCNDLKEWNPVDFNNIISYYNPIDKEIMFINENDCLTFSESLDCFTSFYDYNRTPYVLPLQDKLLLVKNNSLWKYHGGDYNYIYNIYSPFYTTIIANPDIIKDKIFDIVEYRSDSFNFNKDKGKWEVNNDTFDKIETHNEYQSGEADLSYSKYKPSNLKRKFRMWRINIPRDSKHKMDRMRNPWLFIKLLKQEANKNKTILHDITVHYYE